MADVRRNVKEERYVVTPVSKEQLSVLSTRIEAEIARPAALVVTSAGAKDGEDLIVEAVAGNLARSGYRTLLVDAAEFGSHELTPRSAPKVSTLDEFDIASYVASTGGSHEPDRLGLWGAGVLDTSSHENVRGTLNALRSRYDYVLVNTSPAQRSAISLAFAANADATIIAFRLGRAATSSDRDLKQSLLAVGARIIGIVTTDVKAIAAFHSGSRRSGSISATRGRGDEVVKSGTSVSVSL